MSLIWKGNEGCQSYFVDICRQHTLSAIIIAINLYHLFYLQKQKEKPAATVQYYLVLIAFNDLSYHIDWTVLIGNRNNLLIFVKISTWKIDIRLINIGWKVFCLWVFFYIDSVFISLFAFENESFFSQNCEHLNFDKWNPLKLFNFELMY